MRRLVSLWFLFAVLIIMSGLSNVGVGNELTCVPPPTTGVVNKTPGATFTAEIAFKNTGETEGSWSVNVAFECEAWTWKGTPQTLALKPCSKKTLTWNGTVPTDAPIDSTARLIVYYGDSYTMLNWWIHVVSAAQLAITNSTVR